MASSSQIGMRFVPTPEADCPFAVVSYSMPVSWPVFKEECKRNKSADVRNSDLFTFYIQPVGQLFYIKNDGTRECVIYTSSEMLQHTRSLSIRMDLLARDPSTRDIAEILSHYASICEELVESKKYTDGLLPTITLHFTERQYLQLHRDRLPMNMESVLQYVNLVLVVILNPSTRIIQETTVNESAVQRRVNQPYPKTNNLPVVAWDLSLVTPDHNLLQQLMRSRIMGKKVIVMPPHIISDVIATGQAPAMSNRPIADTGWFDWSQMAVGFMPPHFDAAFSVENCTAFASTMRYFKQISNNAVFMGDKRRRTSENARAIDVDRMLPVSTRGAYYTCGMCFGAWRDKLQDRQLEQNRKMLLLHQAFQEIDASVLEDASVQSECDSKQEYEEKAAILREYQDHIQTASVYTSDTLDEMEQEQEHGGAGDAHNDDEDDGPIDLEKMLYGTPLGQDDRTNTVGGHTQSHYGDSEDEEEADVMSREVRVMRTYPNTLQHLVQKLHVLHI
jgi:hypothetical protein